jgi:predicted MFS family arabinose efflux permease
MAIGFIAIVVLLGREDAVERVRVPLSAPFRALLDPAIRTLALAAVFYNIGFFVLLAYTPFPLGMNAIGLGLVFFGWGVAVAITSVWVAPLLTAALRRTTVLAVVMPLLALDLLAAAFFIASQLGLVLAVIVGGLLLGILNTVLTESVMEATELPRSVASSAYSAVRFLGGAVAPPIATELAVLFVPSTPYFFAAGSVLLATVIIILGRRLLGRVDSGPQPPAVEAEAIGVGDAA